MPSPPLPPSSGGDAYGVTDWAIYGDGLPDRVFDHNPEADDQPGFFVYLNTGDGFDNGKQWQSNLGGDD
jgi:hypothetical protein